MYQIVVAIIIDNFKPYILTQFFNIWVDLVNIAL
jgi:hypothetical protein